MLASIRNRCIFNVDNPVDGDGFYRYMTGNKRRRALRRKEIRKWKKEALRELQSD